VFIILHFPVKLKTQTI